MDINEKSGKHVESESESGDSSSSVLDRSSTHGTNQERASEVESDDHHIAGDNDKAVNYSKRFVYVVILIAAVGMSAATYIFTSKEEESDFDRDFEDFAGEVIEIGNQNAARVFDHMHSMATSLTSFALSTGAIFPYATLPHFAIRAEETDKVAGSELIIFAPIVKKDDKEQWEAYTKDNRHWVDTQLGPEAYLPPTIQTTYDFDDDSSLIESSLSRDDIYVPIWEYGPNAVSAKASLIDLYSHPIFHRLINDALKVKHRLLSEVTDMRFIIDHTTLPDKENVFSRSFIIQPVMSSYEEDAEVVGFLIAIIPWRRFFKDILPHGTQLRVSISETCGTEFDYKLNGDNVTFISKHDGRAGYEPCDEHCVHSSFASTATYNGEITTDQDHCAYTIFVRPTDHFHQSYETKSPILYTCVVFMVFIFTASVFFFYDYLVQRRQAKVLNTARQTTAIVTSLFPKQVGKRILNDAVEAADKEERRRGFLRSAHTNNTKDALVNVLEGGMQSVQKDVRTRPIADLFPEVTIMFADIVGFTAWSSMREPSQVFILLESIYREFDEIAHRRRVFKVETVGDCYVAVAGLPEPRRDHATVMARFARDCLYKMSSLTKLLEVELGPDTAELSMRVGLHSGPVTAGVLRGERARFQLFGDTVNTTARMESTGVRDKIHISQETAELLIASGKGHWVTARSEKVQAKGKGELQTYWLDLKSEHTGTSITGTSESGSDQDQVVNKANPIVSAVPTLQKSFKPSSCPTMLSDKQMRLVDWNTDMLSRLLKEIVARREVSGAVPEKWVQIKILERKQMSHTHDKVVLDEVKDIISLPKYNSKAANAQKSPDSIELSKIVTKQLRDYVQTISAMYRDNPFHNFEHASHVTMSVVKLLSRIVAPAINVEQGSDALRTLHDHTYGITSDPLTQFSVIMSALIHDVDHTGVPNNQLVKEQCSIATVYKNKSVAEQNSIDLAWGLLMEECYEDLRRTIYSTEHEFKQFRQVLVNTVLATDIMDKELGASRKARWNLAFADNNNTDTSFMAVNRKATIVIEHLIQASDVAHTMQHWHIYRKWNARLFEEMYRAFKQGRAEKNPADFWYQGELGFFDHYIIPLAMKLRSCGVFGVSSDEYLTYARQNRAEWERKGQDVIAETVQKISLEY